MKSSNPTSLPMSCTYLLRYLWLTQAFAPNLELSTKIRINGNTFVALTRPLDPLVKYFKWSLGVLLILANFLSGKVPISCLVFHITQLLCEMSI